MPEDSNEQRPDEDNPLKEHDARREAQQAYRRRLSEVLDADFGGGTSIGTVVKAIKKMHGGTDIDEEQDEELDEVDAFSVAAPLMRSADIADFAKREVEMASKATNTLLLRILQEPERRREALDALRDLLGAYASKDRGWYGKITENLVRSTALEHGLTSEELWSLTQAMDREQAHAKHLPKIDNIESTMVTGRPLRVHADILSLSDDDLRALDGRRLLLVGGGPVSPIHDELAKKGIHCTVTNVDPGASESDQEEQISIRGNFLDADTTNASYHEAWAVHSLPTYALPAEVVPFYRKALLSLAQGGTLRIAPVDDFRAGITPMLALGNPLACKISRSVLELLEQHPELVTVHRFTVTEDLDATNAKNPLTIMRGAKRPKSAQLKAATITLVADPAKAAPALEQILREAEQLLPPAA